MDTNIYKNVTLRNVPIGGAFVVDGYTYRKVTAKTAHCTDLSPKTVTSFSPSDAVSVLDVDAMTRRDAYLAKPLFDGTPASCTTTRDYFALDAALRDVNDAAEKVDAMTL